MTNYNRAQVQAIREAFVAYANHLDQAADHADASDHWAWEYRYADDVREYLTEWLDKNVPPTK